MSSSAAPGPQRIAAGLLVDGDRVSMCHRHPTDRGIPTSGTCPAEHDALGWFTPVGVAELELPDRVLVDLSHEALASTPADDRRDRSGRV